MQLARNTASFTFGYWKVMLPISKSSHRAALSQLESLPVLQTTEAVRLVREIGLECETEGG